jgi:hypothetical protein
MLFPFLGIMLAVFLTWGLFEYSDTGFEARHFLSGLIGVCLGFITAICTIAFIVLSWEYVAADYKAKIINREYGTTYTAKEIFYANDVIDTIRQIDRQRVEINGNILKK